MTDVTLTQPVARDLLNLLTEADHKQAFGKCEDHMDGKHCTVCTTLTRLQSAIWRAEETDEAAATDE